MPARRKPSMFSIRIDMPAPQTVISCRAQAGPRPARALAFVPTLSLAGLAFSLWLMAQTSAAGADDGLAGILMLLSQSSTGPGDRRIGTR